jgi:hypothetical protein
MILVINVIDKSDINPVLISIVVRASGKAGVFMRKNRIIYKY